MTNTEKSNLLAASERARRISERHEKDGEYEMASYYFGQSIAFRAAHRIANPTNS